jgi:macrolide transport system ATP-binding/permease protein
MESLLQDVRYGFRTLLQKPAFTAVAVLSLALGIGANSTIFAVIDALLLRTVPVEQPETLVAIYTSDAKNPGYNPTSHLNWKDLRDQSRSFSEVAAYDWTQLSVGGENGGEASVAFGQMVSGNYFKTLGIPAARGRVLEPSDDVVGAGEPVAVLSDAFWRERFGGDPAAVGKTLTLNGHVFTVVGVAPRDFKGTDLGVQPELWVPMAVNRQLRPDPEINWYETRRGLFLFTLARLAPGVTARQAEADVGALFTRLAAEYPTDNKGRSFRLVPLTQAYVNPNARGGLTAVSALLATVVGLVLLIACANVANLLLTRASARRREIAVRLSIGAGRGRLVRQLLTESVLLALLGGCGGLLVAYWASQALNAVLPGLPLRITVALDLGVNARVFAFTLVVAVLTGLLFGLVPALQATRPDLVTALKGAATAAAGRGRFGTSIGRGALVTGQVALSLVALIAAGLFLRSLDAARQSDPGFETRRLLALSFDLDLQGYDRARGENFVREALARVGSVPGVATATVAQAGPLQGSMARSVFLEGKEASTDGVLVQLNTVGPGYFAAVGVPIERGRALGEEDRAGTLPAVVVNQTMAARFWPGEDPVGKRFRFFGEEQPLTVVGVARDAKYNALGEDPQPYIYTALGQRWSGTLTLLARTAGDPEPVLATVQREVRALDKQMPLAQVATVDQLLAEGLWAPRMGASLLGIFGLLALVLASVGIYGVTSFAVAQRAREIGIRMALGARRNDVLAMVLGQGMTVVGLGLVVGLAVAFGVTRFAAGLLFGVSPTDPVAFGATSLLLAGVALAANFLPARRATAVDPVTVLKQS